MENRTPASYTPFPKKLLLIGLLVSIACASFPLGLVALPAFWAYAMFRTRPAILGVFFGSFTACALVLYLPNLAIALCFIVIAGASAVILYVMQAKRMSNVITVAALAGVAIVILYAAICMPGILSGAGAFAAIQADAETLVAQLRQMLTAGGAIQTEEMRTLYEAYLEAMPEAIVAAVVPSFCLSGGLLGLGNVLFLRLFARRHDFGLAPMRPFRLWSIPRELTVGLCIMLIGAAILNFMELDYAFGVSSTVNVLVGMPLTLQGICCVDYLLYRKGGNLRRKRILIYIGIGIFFYLMQMGLMLVGCVDQVVRFRERAEGTIPPQQPGSL